MRQRCSANDDETWPDHMIDIVRARPDSARLAHAWLDRAGLDRAWRSVSGRPAVRWVRARGAAVFDLAVALVATIVELGLLDDGVGRVRVLPVTLTVLAGGLLAFRRRAPLLVLAGTGALAGVLVWLGAYPGGAPVLVAMFTVAEVRERRLSLTVLLPTAVLMQVATISSPPVTIGAWALGSYLQTRHRYLAALEDRAGHLEREREQLNQLAAQRERASIARELHDIVAHSVTVMLLGVRGANDVLRTSPEVAQDLLRRVESSAEQSIDELRRILVLLRTPDQVAQVRPAPLLAELPDLVDGYREVGLPVRLTVTGQPRPVPSGVQLSIYRMVEETLTNVLKHSRPSTVTIQLTYAATAIDIEIDDDGKPLDTAEPSTGPGHGILGMRERVAALGGAFDARPLPGGGFRVAARLPIGDLA